MDDHGDDADILRRGGRKNPEGIGAMEQGVPVRPVDRHGVRNCQQIGVQHCSHVGKLVLLGLPHRLHQLSAPNQAEEPVSPRQIRSDGERNHSHAEPVAAEREEDVGAAREEVHQLLRPLVSRALNLQQDPWMDR